MYLLIKTSQEKVNEQGSLFEAARGHWYVNPKRASQCSHAIVTLRGHKDVKAVYKIDNWEHSFYRRHHFNGSTDNTLENKLVGKELNNNLFTKGRKNPISYVQEKELLEV